MCRALEGAGLRPGDVDLLINAGLYHDRNLGEPALAALIAVPAAMAAYMSPKLEVTPTATGVVVKASLDPNDDPTARVAINAPVGTQLTTTQAPGSVLGPVKAIVCTRGSATSALPGSSPPGRKHSAS